jgi:hypothetical protein
MVGEMMLIPWNAYLVASLAKFGAKGGMDE